MNEKKKIIKPFGQCFDMNSRGLLVMQMKEGGLQWYSHQSIFCTGHRSIGQLPAAHRMQLNTLTDGGQGLLVFTRGWSIQSEMRSAVRVDLPVARLHKWANCGLGGCSLLDVRAQDTEHHFAVGSVMQLEYTQMLSRRDLEPAVWAAVFEINFTDKALISPCLAYIFVNAIALI